MNRIAVLAARMLTALCHRWQRARPRPAPTPRRAAANAARLRSDARRGDRSRRWPRAIASAEAEARGEAADAVASERHAATAAAARRPGRLHAHEPRGRVRDPAAEQPAQGHLSGRPGQLPDAARRCSGRSIPPGGSTRWSGRREPRRTRRPTTSTAARGDLRLETTRAYWALVTAIESLHVVERVGDARGRAPARRAQPVECRAGAAERRAERGGAGIAAADAAIQARTTRGRRRSRSRAADRRRARHARLSRPRASTARRRRSVTGARRRSLEEARQQRPRAGGARQARGRRPASGARRPPPG